MTRPKFDGHGCERCVDPDGLPCFPMYGLGPHVHTQPIGGTVLLDQHERPGFTPCEEEPGMGTYWCPYCGDGKPEPEEHAA